LGKFSSAWATFLKVIVAVVGLHLPLGRLPALETFGGHLVDLQLLVVIVVAVRVLAVLAVKNLEIFPSFM
jgi:hypothetical protein